MSEVGTCQTSETKSHNLAGTPVGRGVAFRMIITGSLIVLAILAYFGRSLVMLTSVGGIAVGLWLTRHGDLRTRMAGASVGAVVASIAAEAVHLVYHVVQADVPDHGGFWVSAVLVGLINAAVVIPVLWVDAVVTRRRALRS